MEVFAKEAEEAYAYTMNTEVMSDTEEWQKRKQSTIIKNQQQTSNLYTSLYTFFAMKLLKKN